MADEIEQAHETAKRIVALAYSADLSPTGGGQPDMRLEMAEETLRNASALQLSAIAIRLASVVIYQADQIQGRTTGPTRLLAFCAGQQASTTSCGSEMADARLRSDWLGQMRFDDLSDTAWRIFTSALMWSVGNGTDGEIPKRYLRYLHPEGVKPDANVEIVKAGLWTEQGDAFVMVGWDGDLGQSTAEQIEKYKEDARERQRRRRERARERRESQEAIRTESTSQSEGVTPNVTRDVTPNVGIGTGSGIGTGTGTGEGYEIGTEQSLDERTGEVTSWSARKPGEPDAWIEAESGEFVPVGRGAA